MKKIYILIFIGYFLLLAISAALAQGKPKVIITGARFTYPLVEEWIHQYKAVNPNVEVVIDPRTTTDPSTYDLLLEAYENDKSLKDTRDYF
jgi:ABC-type phosphate transport system substrate-binding protein